jgi:hypothetical protein
MMANRLRIPRVAQNKLLFPSMPPVSSTEEEEEANSHGQQESQYADDCTNNNGNLRRDFGRLRGTQTSL